MGPKFINPGFVPALGDEPHANAIPKADHWTVSLKYWKQAKFFGVSELTPKDFVDILTGIKEIEPILGPLYDGTAQQYRAYHYHKVDWTKAKVRFSREDITWLPPAILTNEQEFPIFQISLCKGTNRILGFHWAEEQIFYIVLIDPHHNAQKAAGFEKATNCEEVLGSHHQLLKEISNLHLDLESHTKCAQNSCEFALKITRLHKAHSVDGIVYLPQDCIQLASELIQDGKFSDIPDIFMTGILTGTSAQKSSPTTSSTS